MPKGKAPEQTSKPARRVSPPPATERLTCNPNNETFARKVEGAEFRFLQELDKCYADTVRKALWIGEPIKEREKRDRELEPLLISWLESSVQCIEERFWELHNIAATSPDGPKDSAADWAGQAAGEVVRGYFKFEKEINAVVPNKIFLWWRFATEHAGGVSQDVPERWNSNFSSRIERVLESLAHQAVLGSRGPSLARTMPVGNVVTPAPEVQEHITPPANHSFGVNLSMRNADPLPSIAELLAGTDFATVPYDALTLRKIEVIERTLISELLYISEQTAAAACCLIDHARKVGEDARSQDAIIIGRAVDSTDSWQKQSLGSIERWFWEAYEVGVTSSIAGNATIPDWAHELINSIVEWYFFAKRLPPPAPPTIMHWWLSSVRSQNLTDGPLSVGAVFDLADVFRNRFQVLLLQLQGEAVLKCPPAALAVEADGLNSDQKAPPPTFDDEQQRFNHVAGPLWRKAWPKRKRPGKVPDTKLAPVLDCLIAEGFDRLDLILEVSGCESLKQHNTKVGSIAIETLRDFKDKVIGRPDLPTGLKVCRNDLIRRLGRARDRK